MLEWWFHQKLRETLDLSLCIHEMDIGSPSLGIQEAMAQRRGKLEGEDNTADATDATDVSGTAAELSELSRRGSVSGASGALRSALERIFSGQPAEPAGASIGI